MTDYQLYIDDSGMKEYFSDKQKYIDDLHTRYFVFGAYIIKEVDISRFVEKIREKKIKYFHDEKVEIKSNWIRIPKERESRYLQKYNITETEFNMFVQEIYEIISESPIQLIGAVVDKLQTVERYPQPWYAPAIAYEILLQRVVQEIITPDRIRVVVDDMSGSTPKGHPYKTNLSRQHEQLKKIGTRLIPGISFQSLFGNIRFINSAFSDQIQIADIVAYNLFRQFVDHGEDWENSKPNVELPTYKYFKRICKKFRRGPNNRIQGFGVVKFPTIKRIPWSLVRRKRKAAP